MAEQKELFSEQEQYAACSRFKRCRKCKRRLHADHKERFETRVAGLCYACVREFEKSPHWDIDRFLGVPNAVEEFMEEAEQFECMLVTSLEPVRIEERLVHRIGVREWGLPTLAVPGQIWRSEKHGTISCMLPHPTEQLKVSIETRSLEVIPVDEMSWMPDAWRAALWSYVQEWWTSGCHLGPFLAISDTERAKFLRKLCMKLADSDHIGALHVAHAIGQFAALDFKRPTANA